MEIHGARILCFFYCYMSIPDKVAHPLLDGGCADEHEKGGVNRRTVVKGID